MPGRKNITKGKSKVLEGLNQKQIEAVTFGPPAGGGPLLIIAGAGSGKTTVITRRVAWLIEQNLAKPEEILALTFTEKAAGEMQERVDQLMPLGFFDMNISTFHAFAQVILKQHALDIGLPGDFKILTETAAWMLIKKHLYDFGLDYYKPVGNPNRFIYALLKHFGKLKGEEITPEEYLLYAQELWLKFDQPEIKRKARKKNKEREQETENSGQPKIDEAEVARINEVATVYHYYQKLLLDNSFLDFGDLINYTLKLFRSRPKILQYYQNQFKYILVDEFQDTDLSQYELVKMLLLPNNNITVVGDDDQSIYKFRGASISNILKFKEDYPMAYQISLTDNYRSTQEILDLAHEFIQLNNPERLESKLSISKKLVSHNKTAGEIIVLHARTVFEEAKSVVDKILDLKTKNDLSFNDFAVLVRANDHAEPFLTELSRHGLPYIFVANRGLYKKPIILDILAYLGLLDNYHESENLFRLLNMDNFKIDDYDLIQISQTAKRRTLSLYEVLDQNLANISQKSKQKVNGLLSLIKKHTQLAREKTASEMLVKIILDLGIIASLSQDSLENYEHRSLLDQFYKKTLAFEQENDDKTIKGFLNLINLELEAGEQGQLNVNPDLGPDAIRVMTVHSAKGLEFECVFIVNLVEARFPSRERRDPIEIPEELVKEILPEGDVHLMEERRLFYVAVSRAKRFLYFAWADDYGGVSFKKPSRFLIETGLEQKRQPPSPSGEVFFAKPKRQLARSIKLTLPSTFSFTQISSFLHCPLEYKYRYIYSLPLPGEAQFSFGSTIHKTLEKFLQNLIQLNSSKQADLFGSKIAGLNLPNKELLSKFYEESWIDDWYENQAQKKEYWELGKKQLANFYERFVQNPKIPKFLEQPFKLKLGDHKFVGKIDRADLNQDGSVDIIDYKTGMAREKLSPVDKEQLLTYQWAAQDQFGLKVRSLSYWYLNNTEELREFIGKQDDLAELKEKFLEVINQITDAVNNNSFTILDQRISHECKFRKFVV